MAYVPETGRDGRTPIVSATAPSGATQQRIRSERGTGIAVFSNAEELVSGPAVDEVFIAVSEASHEEARGAALEAGAPMFYEPPLASRRDQVIR